jgi:hypothetical protein
MSKRESEIETAVCDYAKSKYRWLAYKFVSPSNRGVPDRIFIRNGDVFFIEFKAWKNIPTKLQKRVITKIRDYGIDVYVVDNVEQGKGIFDERG